MRPRFLTVAIALLLTLLCGGCRLLGGSLPSPAAGSLDGDWVLVSGTNDGTAIPIAEGAEPTLTIDGETVGGRAACNTYGGTMSRDGDRITFSAMQMTEMACDEPRMTSEAAYVAALGAITGATRSGTGLTLTGPTTELRFAAVPPVTDRPLAGTTWQLDTILVGETASSVLGGPVSLVLDAQGALSGGTGCRSFSGQGTLQDGHLVVTDLVNDDRACPASLDDQDLLVLAVIGGSPTVHVDGNRLTLSLADGRGLGYFAAGE